MFLAIFLILSVVANGVMTVLYVHSRCSYRRLMQKSLQQEEPEKKLVSSVSFDVVEVDDELELAVLDKLQASLERDRLYLRPELTIQELAKVLGTNKATLSHVINSRLHQNFSSLINGYRIRESMRLLSDPQYFREKMEVVGEMCGYNNRQVFHAAFKKEMGITPNHFRNIQKTTARAEKRSAQGDDARPIVDPS